MSFSDIYGQKYQSAILQNAIKRNRVAHAYLFHGIDGTGKRTAAKTFAKALNCLTNSGDPCDICSQCRKIEHGNHPDLCIIRPSGLFIKIDEIRTLQNQTRLKPFEGKKRIFIIENAQTMNSPAANAFLKTLEEPSSSNVMILTAASAQQLPKTILSRCQKIYFAPLTPDAITSFLIKQRSIETETAVKLASLSGGSIGKALELINADPRLSFKKTITAMLANIDSSDPMVFLSFADAFGNDRKTIMEKLIILKGLYRDVLVFKETTNTAYLINKDFTDFIQAYANRISGKNILQCLTIVDFAYNAIDMNVNKQLTLETMVFKLLQI